MIERYTRPEMAEIWSDERRYRSWVRIEVAVCRALVTSPTASYALASAALLAGIKPDAGHAADEATDS